MVKKEKNDKKMKPLKRILPVLISVLLIAAPLATFASNGSTIVYITDTGKRYHNFGCRSLQESCHETTIEYAVSLGLTPCGICHPPVYDGEINVTPDPTPDPTPQPQPDPIPQPVQPDIVTEGDWSYAVDNEKATVKAYYGNTYFVVVPDTLGGYPVTTIDSGTFSNNTTMQYLTLPKGLKTINESAVSDCPGLKRIFYEGTIDQWNSIAIADSEIISFSESDLGTYGEDPATILTWESVLVNGKPASKVLCYCQEGQTATAYAAKYDAAGRFISIVAAPLEQGDFNELLFLKDNASSMHIFVMNKSYAPLCESAEVLR